MANSTHTTDTTKLQDQTILVTRAAGQSSQFTQLLQHQGATVLELPAIVIMAPSSWEAFDQAVTQLDSFDWLILTSTNGVDYFFDRLAALNQAELMAGLKIAVVGQKTAARLQQKGYPPDFIPPDFVADSLVTHFPVPVAGLKILFPRVESGGRDVLVKELTAQGAEVTEVAAYQSGCAPSIPIEVVAALEQQQVTIITFASSKTVTCVHRLLSSHEPNLLPLTQPIQLASIGPQTSATCQALFGRVDIEATDYTLEGLTEALIRSRADSMSRTL